MIDLPPLPEPDVRDYWGEALKMDKVRTYGEACARAALEAAAIVADKEAGQYWGTQTDDAIAIAAKRSAAAIRALLDKP